jgi:hypothetical protein
MKAEMLAGAVGVVLGLLLSCVPGLNARFDALSATGKRLVVLALLVVAAGGAFALGCLPAAAAGLGVSLPACSQVGAWGLARVLAAAVITNQTAFLLSPRRPQPMALAHDTLGPFAVERMAVRRAAQLVGHPASAVGRMLSDHLLQIRHQLAFVRLVAAIIVGGCGAVPPAHRPAQPEPADTRAWPSLRPGFLGSRVRVPQYFFCHFQLHGQPPDHAFQLGDALLALVLGLGLLKHRPRTLEKFLLPAR